MPACPVCSVESIAKGPELYACPSCTHVFQYPPDVRVSYAADYLATYDRYPVDLMSHVRLSYVKAHVSGGKLLDVGYGQGHFVRLAVQAGFDAYGNDVHGVDCGVREVGLNHGMPWDVVTFFDSLEHFPSLAPIKDLANRSRYVVVSLPCRPTWFPSQLEWKHYKPGEHLHYFCEESLDRLFCPKHRLSSGDVEDVVRGKGPTGGRNILTAVYGA
jgi:hypothetical protein